jgi:hypothetical protein
MKKLLMMLAAVMAMMMGCGKDDCEKAFDVQNDAMKAACKGKSCWFCECYANQKGKVVDYDSTFKAVGCKDAPPVENKEYKEGDKCEGEAETYAKKCLDDEAACKKRATEGLEEGCESTAK